MIGFTPYDMIMKHSFQLLRHETNRFYSQHPPNVRRPITRQEWAADHYCYFIEDFQARVCWDTMNATGDQL